MNMIEQVARAICAADVEWYAEQFPSVPVEIIREIAAGDLTTNYSVLARAAIEAMRVPTEGMVEAAYDADDSSMPLSMGYGEVYTAMIDAALEGE